ncbi:recombinase family protein [Clostridium coskatii]|uniref:Recombinase n=1 Tax=Clostridium coskatii TaxID=1705578 RepID=A0A166RXG7_9CLOT|nr:recombinase family protein [Clostridium coskatii]OAA91331.1 Recombinase [Clostridium coskatii]OBR93963.1 recombinase [Clostridium coskatii]
MPKVTIKSLQEKIKELELINECQSNEIDKLTAEIDTLKNNKNMVSIEEYALLLKQLEDQKQTTAEYKELYANLNKEKVKLKNKLKNFEKKVKPNARNAGRKAFSNKKVIKKIYSMYLDGKSLQQVSHELNRTGIKTNQGKEWSKSSIRFILLNSKNVINGFIGEDIYNSAVKLLNDNKKTP